jgi:antitoxin component of RelBE/YafQ-DinJ toxin-antitoxin module
MSLERVDVRAKLDPDVHEALVAICDARGLTLGEFIETLLVPEIKRVVHEATVITDKLRISGTNGKNRD